MIIALSCFIFYHQSSGFAYSRAATHLFRKFPAHHLDQLSTRRCFVSSLTHKGSGWATVPGRPYYVERGAVPYRWCMAELSILFYHFTNPFLSSPSKGEAFSGPSCFVNVLHWIHRSNTHPQNGFADPEKLDLREEDRPRNQNSIVSIWLFPSNLVSVDQNSYVDP